MYEKLEQAVLKDGEAVECGVVAGPDEAWAGRLEGMLGHKGGLWNWQNSQMLRTKTGLDARYYLLHRGGEAFANVCVFAAGGVGILGHVWTKPEDRRKGASSRLMKAAMGDFARRGGKALYLGTESAGVAHDIYEREGFADVEKGTGRMAWYPGGKERIGGSAAPTAEPPFDCAQGLRQAKFETGWFAPGAAGIERLGWRHWPAAVPLFLEEGADVVRCAPMRAFGRMLIEGLMLPMLQTELARQEAGQGASAAALVNERTRAVEGLAAWAWDALWPATALVDVYCHAGRWGRAGELLRALELPAGLRVVAYGDRTCADKAAALKGAGFEQAAVLPRWIAGGPETAGRVDVLVFEKSEKWGQATLLKK